MQNQKKTKHKGIYHLTPSGDPLASMIRRNCVDPSIKVLPVKV